MAPNAYHKNYLSAIAKGLELASFFIHKEEVAPDYFWLEVKNILTRLRKSRNRIFFFGNGASAAFANHMALDFSKNGKILSRSLSDSALLTALANDFSYESAMVEFMKIENVGSSDLVITISSSGNSLNIINVLKYCFDKKISTLSLSGLKPDNKSISNSMYSIYVPMKTYGMVECIHQIFLHMMLDEMMEIREWEKSDTQNMNSQFFKL
jgi:D-sedoheptulose 7-phosphate isomerase